MKDYENDYADPTQSPDWEHGDELPSNTSDNPNIYEIMEARASRRDLMLGGLAAAVSGVFGAGARTAQAAETAPSALLGFKPVPVATIDAITVPEGYRSTVIAVWGDPINGSSPAFDPAASGADQALQVGTHHDGMHYFPIDGSSNDGLLVMNHEYIEPRFLHSTKWTGQTLSAGQVVMTAEGKRVDDEVLKEMNAHGVSVLRVQDRGEGQWRVVDDPRNRRVTVLTPMRMAGPAAGSRHLVTKFSPDGTRTRGTVNNCAHGVTPWGTYLTCEENWAGYFTNTGEQPREHRRYGVSDRPEGNRYAWHLAESGADEYVRFDATAKGASAAEDYRNEPNTFGWVVEIDPQDPASTPVKRTHLGRFAHEGVVFGPAIPGKPVVAYSGDDARFEYIYKFVSSRAYDPATADGSLLDEGTLYAARFNADGSGEWLALAPGRNGLTPENGFADLADILVNTRLAADRAGATKMDRPEWGAVDPNTGEVYFTLTNNTRRTLAQVDAANPRSQNQFGSIIRWTEQNDDHTATAFQWDLFVLAGNVTTSRTAAGEPLNEDNIFACPDGLWFDADSRLWIQTDIGEADQNRGALEPMGNNAMLCADPRTAEIRRFLTGPFGQEITGVITTPDQRTMFINVQHPGATTTPEAYAAGQPNSHWPGEPGSVPRCATVVITKLDGGVIGA